MRLLPIVFVLAALCLSGCATDKSFEKEILGHQAPPSPTDTGWPRGNATPPPPPPAPQPGYAPPAPTAPQSGYAPASSQPAYAPAAPQPGYAPAATTAPQPGYAPAAAPAPAATTPQAANPQFTPKPFTPTPQSEAPGVEKPGAVLFEQQGVASGKPASPAAPAQPAPQAASTPAAAPATPGEHAFYTFQVGAFAHAQSAKELMATLESRGFSTRIEQGKLNNKTFYNVFAAKEGSRASLEAELLAGGVTEPRLAEERPIGAAPAGKGASRAKTAPAVAPAPASKVSAPIAPPIVEPAPPLPDGYVPPPKKTNS